jgi:hypothetical protein
MSAVNKFLRMLFVPVAKEGEQGRPQEEAHVWRQRCDEAVARCDLLETRMADLEMRLAGLPQRQDATLRHGIRRPQVLRDRAAREGRRLHVIGYARSGTTILMDILNSSGDVFLFSELNLHVLQKLEKSSGKPAEGDFLQEFLERKKRELPLLYKSAVPPVTEVATPAANDTDTYFSSLGKRFLYVGDKIATSHRTMAGVPDIVALEEFIQREEQRDAVMFFTLRRPSENLVSVAKMFPEADVKAWAKSLAESMLVFVKSFLTGNRSYLVFHEDIGPELVDEMSEMLDVDFPISPALVGKSHQATQGAGQFADQAWAIGLDDAYLALKECFCHDGIVKCSKTDGLVKKLDAAVSRTKSAIDEIAKT